MPPPKPPPPLRAYDELLRLLRASMEARPHLWGLSDPPPWRTPDGRFKEWRSDRA